MILWQSSTQNYFYGEFQAHRLSVNGRWECCKKNLKDGEPKTEDWKVLGVLPPSALEKFKDILKSQFYSLSVDIPEFILPDDFPLVCQSELEGAMHQVTLYSHHDAISKSIIGDIQDWIAAHLVKI